MFLYLTGKLSLYVSPCIWFAPAVQYSTTNDNNDKDKGPDHSADDDGRIVVFHGDVDAALLRLEHRTAIHHFCVHLLEIHRFIYSGSGLILYLD